MGSVPEHDKRGIMVPTQHNLFLKGRTLRTKKCPRSNQMKPIVAIIRKTQCREINFFQLFSRK